MKLTDLPNISKVIASEIIESRNQYEGGFAMFAMRPLDDKEHKKRHTDYLRKSRIASRYAKKESKLFASNAEERFIVSMIGLGDIGEIPKALYHQDEPLYLYKNISSFIEREISMDDLCLDGFAVVKQHEGRWFYHLTYRGFEALAGWLDRDLVCQPKGNIEAGG